MAITLQIEPIFQAFGTKAILLVAFAATILTGAFYFIRTLSAACLAWCTFTASGVKEMLISTFFMDHQLQI
jgi:hypothetical protein